MYLKHIFLILFVVIVSSLTHAMEDKETDALTAVSKRNLWPAGTPDSITAIPLDKDRAELKRRYDRFETDQKKAYKGLLSSIEVVLRSSPSKGFSHTTTDSLISSLVAISNEGYIPAFVKLSELFRGGLYSMPQDTAFARQLLDLVSLDEEVVNFFDSDSVHFLLQDLKSRRSLTDPEISTALGVGLSAFGRFLSRSLYETTVEKSFKTNYSNLIPLGLYLCDTEEGTVSAEEKKGSPLTGVRRRK